MSSAAILALLTQLLPALIQGGGILAQVIPSLSSTISAITSGVATPSSQINIVSLVQELLNALNTAGVITLTQPLTVDGVFGGDTFAAIKLLQAKFGLNLGEPLASYEMEALTALFKVIP